MIYGLIPLAISAIGVTYATLVFRGSLRRDNVVFGVLALVDAAMTAWRALNALTGLSLARSGARVSYGTSVSIADARALLAGMAQALDAYFANPP